MSSASSTSTSSVVTTLVVNLVLAVCFIVAFLLLRVKFKRIYSPRADCSFVPDDKKVPPLPKDPFRWIYILLTMKNHEIIERTGIDGYFFLRYLWVMASIFLGGCLTLIILFPVNATNGKPGEVGFDKISISDIKNPNRYYAHVFIGWIYHGAVVFVLFRELYFCNSLRAAALSSPKYALRRSSRTIMFRFVPDPFLDTKQIFKLYNGVKRIYLSRYNRQLVYKVTLRNNLVAGLENSETKLISKAVKSYNKEVAKAKKNNTTVEINDDINRWVPDKKRPKKGSLFSKKEDLIEYYRKELPRLDKEIRNLQKKYSTFTPRNTVFVEFEDQYMAQLAYQTISCHNPMNMSGGYIGVEPADIVWPNLRLFWWESIIRKLIAIVFVALTIIFWAIPVAFIGVITNITWLMNKLHWLRWIGNLPKELYGIITGLAPSVLLTLLNTLLPIFIRYMGKVYGCGTTQAIEQFTQNAYFVFLVVNSFLIVAATSSAASVVTTIVKDPTKPMNLLAQQLPKSSNFFMSYVTLQGLTVSSGSILQLVGLIVYYILSYLLDKTLRQKWGRYSGLGGFAWGSTYPLYTMIACVALAYSMLSPFFLVFAFFAFLLFYIVFAYNSCYVNVEASDSRGAFYRKAILQTFTGLYIGQVALLGIVVVGKGWGPIVLQAIALASTAVINYYLNRAFLPLLNVVPVDCMIAIDGESHTPSYKGQSDYRAKVLSEMKKVGFDEMKVESKGEPISENNTPTDSPEDDKTGGKIITEDDKTGGKIITEAKGATDSGEVTVDENLRLDVPLLAERDMKKLRKSTNPIVRFLRPDVFLNFRHVREEYLPASFCTPVEEPDNKHAYSDPIATAGLNGLWIPQDPMGCSKKEVEKFSRFMNASDENSTFNKKGKPTYLGPPPN